MIARDEATIRNLLDGGTDVNLKREKTGASALLIACDMGSTEIVRLLLERGAEVNEANVHGDTPLLRAAGSEGFRELIPLLLAKGADATVRSRQGGMTSLFQVVIQSLKAEPQDVISAIERLAVAGADVDAGFDDGFTPLMFAARGGKRGLAEALIRLGADVNAADAAGRTALGLAAEEGHEELATLLRSQGAKGK